MPPAPEGSAPSVNLPLDVLVAEDVVAVEDVDVVVVAEATGAEAEEAVEEEEVDIIVTSLINIAILIMIIGNHD